MVGTASEGAGDRQDRITGTLLGTAVGDALGLPMEGMSARRAGRMFGAKQLPPEWVNGLTDWPRSVSWLRKLGARLAAQQAANPSTKALGPLQLFWPGLLARNVMFTAIVLMHGLRRMLPPY
jgi:hypothetical protein